MTDTTTRREPTVRVALRGSFRPDITHYARTKVLRVLHQTRRPVLDVRIRLSRHADPAVDKPVLGQVNADVDGRLVRVQVQAHTAREAVDALEAKLRRRLERVGEHSAARRERMSSLEPHEWRHLSEPTQRPAYFPRPEAEREVVRRKSFGLQRCTIDDAVEEMNLLDYDFHVFTEAGTGRDSVVFRAGPTGYRLAQASPPHPDAMADVVTNITLSSHPAPVLSTDEAVERLGLTGWRFVFFVDAGTRRGHVLYHRYDGNYGLITPSE